jgi:hypothetical protein
MDVKVHSIDERIRLASVHDDRDADGQAASHVMLWLHDGTLDLIEDAFIAGVWEGCLIISRDREGTGMDFAVERSIPLADLRRVEMVARDDGEEATSPDWRMGWP